MALALPVAVKWKEVQRWAYYRRKVFTEKYLPVAEIDASGYLAELEFKWLDYRTIHLQYSYPGI